MLPKELLRIRTVGCEQRTDCGRGYCSGMCAEGRVEEGKRSLLYAALQKAALRVLVPHSTCPRPDNDKGPGPGRTIYQTARTTRAATLQHAYPTSVDERVRGKLLVALQQLRKENSG